MSKNKQNIKKEINDVLANIEGDKAIKKTINTVKTISNIIQNMEESSREEYIIALNGLSKEELANINKTFNSFSIGSSAMTPLTCPASSICPHYNVCPFVKDNVVLKFAGKKCPLETNLFTETVKALIIELGVTDNDYIKLRLIMELAEIEVLDMRATNVLSSDLHMSLVVKQEQITVNGDSVDIDTISKAMEIKEKLQNRKMKLMHELLGTPSAKAKAKISTNEQKEIADLRGKLKKIIDKTNGTDGAMSSLEIEVDDFIEAEVIDK